MHPLLLLTILNSTQVGSLRNKAFLIINFFIIKLEFNILFKKKKCQVILINSYL